ncbi:MAG: serine/threonine-protein kinase [Myxococcota bacterium]
MKVGRDVPERVGRYEVLRFLGTGGMASVWLARYRVVDKVYRHVALKAMHAHLRGEPEWLEAFLREAHLAAAIEHPRVVSVIEVLDDALGVFLVMEYVAGPTLGTLARESRLPLPVAGRILLDALEGLHAAHDVTGADGTPLGIVHRDFTPQNILVGRDGIAKLTDFGVARMASQTTTGSLKGKLGYMAPEQLRGESLDRRCDLWAAAVVAWELVAGARMFKSRGEMVVIPQLNEAHFPLAQHHEDAPAELDALLQDALDENRAVRPATALAFAANLTRIWKKTWGIASHEEVAHFLQTNEGGETTGRTAAAVTEFEPAPRRWPIPPWLVAACLVVGAGTAWFALGGAPSAATTTAPTPPAAGDEGTDDAVVPAAAAPSTASGSAPEPAAKPEATEELPQASSPELTIRSDVAVKALSVGSKVIALPRPQREVVVAVPPVDAVVVVRAVDGRVRELSGPFDATPVEIQFGPRPRWRPATPSPSPPSGLHPMP